MVVFLSLHECNLGQKLLAFAKGLILLASFYIISVITEYTKESGDALSYTLEPFPLSDQSYSETVFFLSKEGTNPIQDFYKQNKDAEATRKIAIAVRSVSERGFNASVQTRLLRKLRGINKRNDLYEIRAYGCTARAFSFLVESETILVVAFIEKVHSGQADNETRRAAKKLDSLRLALEKELERRRNDERIQ